MSKINPQIDNYIDKAAPFAQPILNHLRELIHEACPEVEEKMKWSFPHFDYKGEMMCSMAGFKQHCAFNFWKGKLIKSAAKYLEPYDNHSMSRISKITSLKDLPPDKLFIKMVKEACALNDAGIKETKKKKTISPIEIAAPDYFKKALSKNKTAEKIFNASSPSYKKEYISWVVEAKTEATREKRISTAVEWIAEGKGRNWKYER
jgi:uncharacterized protein YdeI (YjbR/CyaY-like superfamily)